MLYLFDSSMDEVLARVAALPPRSIVLFVSMLKDAAGNRFVPAEALASIATKASAPTYVFLDQYVGLGAVGGNVYSYAEDASHVVALGARILRGEAPSSIPVLARSARIDVFDERQLRRWKLDESRLPAGSVVRNRQPSVWDTYRWYIVAAVALLLVQGTLIAGLLIARRRQRLAEAEARKQRDELAHVLRVTTLNELTTSLAHEINQPLAAILLNAQAAMRLLGTDRPTRAKDVEEALTDIVASADHASGVIGRLRALFRKESIEPRPVDVRSCFTRRCSPRASTCASPSRSRCPSSSAIRCSSSRCCSMS
jgi:signal transduction histidine kinase